MRRADRLLDLVARLKAKPLTRAETLTTNSSPVWPSTRFAASHTAGQPLGTGPNGENRPTSSYSRRPSYLTRLPVSS